jgi:L-alanine-DL-glutamate epimerase-like enolase superfamily enzyme
MADDLSRRSLFQGSAALAAGTFLPRTAFSSQAAATAAAAGRPSLTLTPLELKLTHTWTISRNSSNAKKNGLVTLVADGVTGYGEAAANVRYGQSWESGEAAFARVKKAVEGLSPWEHLTWLERAEKEAGGDSQIVAALDTALWDWKGKKLGAPIHRLLGMPTDRMAVTTYSIGIDTAEAMQKKVR